MRRRLHMLIDDDGFVVLILSTYAVGLLVVAAKSVTPDTWLAIVGGREIIGHGLPHHDHLTVIASGRRWIDQQWLAHVVFYGLYKVGGLKLITFANAVSGLAAATAAAAFARRRGATARAVGWTSAVALVPFLAFAVTPRAQSLVYPLFVAGCWLLVSDALKDPLDASGWSFRCLSCGQTSMARLSS